MLRALFFIVYLPLLIAVGYGLWLVLETRSRNKRKPRFEYVYVEDDGSVRELDNEEKQYLNTKFDCADGARPYIKSRYESLTSDGLLGGYLQRRQLPKGVHVRPERGEPVLRDEQIEDSF